jgi:DNA (cytosine-5)-methyltransferase 1
MAAYYNEIDPFAAAWLRELIKAGLIADGEVDERSIADVRPDDLRRFAQCHFFAGIGGWSYALRLAGWSDERACWTGSCPCQPFSSAGKGEGFNDPRHLWPSWFRLIRKCRPRTILGEQVASSDGLAWFDTVATDLEGEDYAVGQADLPAAGLQAAIKRQRLWFVGVAEPARARDGGLAELARTPGNDIADAHVVGRGETRPLAGAAGERRERTGSQHQPNGRTTKESRRLRDARIMGGADRKGLQAGRPITEGADWWLTGRVPEPTSATGSAWRDAEWIYCTDGKYRAVEPGTFPLAHGVPARVGRLRGYGNAIVPQVAQVFIEAYMSLEQNP